MFDWFWEFLYSLSKALMKVCDWLMDVSRALIGIDPITVNGKSTDFITYLISSESVSFAFKTAFSIGIIVLFLFTILSIILNIAKEDKSQTPGQITAKALKSFIGFLIVPAAMIVLIAFINSVMGAIYQATNGGAKNLGSYLFTCFAGSAGLSEGDATMFLNMDLDYYDTDVVASHIALNKFDFLFSWLVCGFVLFNLISSLLLFVERAISIVILYIAAPFSIGSSVLDDGGHFKTWREQVITKFLTAYGAVISINIFLMIVSLVLHDSIQFFSDDTLNKVCKIMIVLGGALSMRKGTVLIAQLLSPNSFHDVADSLASGRGFAKGVFGAGKTAAKLGLKAGTLPFKAGRGAHNFAKDASKKGFGYALGSRMGIKTNADYEKNGGSSNDDNKESNDNQNNSRAKFDSDTEKKNLLSQALTGGSKNKQDSGSNANNNKASGSGNSMVSDAIRNSISNKK